LYLGFATVTPCSQNPTRITAGSVRPVHPARRRQTCRLETAGPSHPQSASPQPPIFRRYPHGYWAPARSGSLRFAAAEPPLVPRGCWAEPPHRPRLIGGRPRLRRHGKGDHPIASHLAFIASAEASGSSSPIRIGNSFLDFATLSAVSARSSSAVVLPSAIRIS
jgi:hypothetical protein